jgi:hypothetical protein
VLRVSAASVVVSGLALLAMATPASAVMGCGQYSFAFDGALLLNDGVSNTAGPFAIEVPAGTYDVAVQTHDAHDENREQLEQTQEQVYFTLDSGYVSAVTTDIRSDRNTAVDEFLGQEIGASTSVVLHHLGEGGVNSLDVTCVGFTPVAPPKNADDVPSEVSKTDITAHQPIPTSFVGVGEAESPRIVESPAGGAVPIAELAKAVGVGSPALDVELLAFTGPSTSWLAITIGALCFVLGGVILGSRPARAGANSQSSPTTAQRERTRSDRTRRANKR